MKQINTGIFNRYFQNQNKDLHKSDEDKNEKIVNHANDALIQLRNAVNRKQIPHNENSDKVIYIVDKVLDFNNQQKGKRFNIWNSKQMLQRLPIALAQVQVVNTSKNVLNKIHQITFSLYQAIEITKK